MAARSVVIFVLALSIVSCDRGPAPDQGPRQQAPTVILKQKPKSLTDEQRRELGFDAAVITRVEAAAEARAEPFFEQVMMRSLNLKGDVMISTGRLCGFSVRTRAADELIRQLSRPLREQGFLIFRSEQNIGSVPDVVSVVRGASSYDILRIQQTESAHYNLTTRAIIAWLREQQKTASFVVTGAGADWVEARFVHPPRNMQAFAGRVAAFAPDVLREDHGTVERLAKAMAETNGFRLVWD